MTSVPPLPTPAPPPPAGGLEPWRDSGHPAVVGALRLAGQRRYAEALQRIEHLQASGPDEVSTDATLCETLVRWSARTFDGHYAPGLGEAIEAISRLNAHGYRFELAWAFSQAGFGMGLVGDLEGGLQWMDLAMSLAGARGEPEMLCKCQGNKGTLLALALDREGALQAYAQALVLCPPEATTIRSSLLNNRAYSTLSLAQRDAPGSLQQRRRAEAALAAALQSREGLDPQQHLRWWVWSQGNEAGALTLLGRHDEAEAVFRDGLPRASVNSRIELVMMSNYGRMLASTGRHDEARALLERAYAMALDSAQTDLLDPTLDGIVEHLQLNERLAGRDGPALRWADERIRRLEQQHGTRLKAVRRHVELFDRLEQERRSEREQAQAQLRYWQDEARRDPLTGLLNRRGLDEATEPLCRTGVELAVAVLDLDHFKVVNDRFGHAVGDRVLQAGAALMRSGTRGNDHLARLGGEEFCLVLDGCSLADAQRVCEQLRAAVQAHDWAAIAPGLQVTVSVGVAAGAGGLAALIEAADRAMYRAKQTGRNRVVVAA